MYFLNIKLLPVWARLNCKKQTENKFYFKVRVREWARSYFKSFGNYQSILHTELKWGFKAKEDKLSQLFAKELLNRPTTLSFKQSLEQPLLTNSDNILVILLFYCLLYFTHNFWVSLFIRRRKNNGTTFSHSFLAFSDLSSWIGEQ